MAEPAGTPPDAVKGINAAGNGVPGSPEAAHYFGTKGYEIAGGTPQAFADFLAAESGKWGRAVRLAGLLK